MAKFLGIDCGATNLRIGIVDQEGKLLSHKISPSPLKTEPEKLAGIVKDLVRDMGDINGIGIGLPGPLDLKNGIILPSSNLGNIAPIIVRQKFELTFNCLISLDRDTNVALLGEVWKGAAKGCQDVIMLTLGSGVGGAILEGGEIERGESGKAGEIGHMYLQVKSEKLKVKNLPKCGLGHEGCLEALIASADNMDELAFYLGYGLSNIVDIFNPEKVIIGGGKLKMGDFLPKAVKIMKETGMKPAVDEVGVEYAKLGSMAGVYGAAKLVYDNNQNT